MEDDVMRRVEKDLITGLSNLSEEKKNSPNIVLGGHNVFNNTITDSIVIQLNASGEDLAKVLENTPENLQKVILKTILDILDKKHRQDPD